MFPALLLLLECNVRTQNFNRLGNGSNHIASESLDDQLTCLCFSFSSFSFCLSSLSFLCWRLRNAASVLLRRACGTKKCWTLQSSSSESLILELSQGIGKSLKRLQNCKCTLLGCKQMLTLFGAVGVVESDFSSLSLFSDCVDPIVESKSDDSAMDTSMTSSPSPSAPSVSGMDLETGFTASAEFRGLPCVFAESSGFSDSVSGFAASSTVGTSSFFA